MVGLVGWAAASRLPLTPPLGLLQVNLGYLCQACTSLLHSRKMLQHYLQVTEPLSAAAAWTASPLASVGSSHLLSPPQNKNGEGIPSAVAPRAQRPPTAAPSCSSSKQPTPDTEASEQRALHTVQYGLLKILSRTLAALRHFTPDVCQILLDQVPATCATRLQWSREGSAVPCSAPRAAWALWGPTSLSSCLALQSLDLAEYDFLFALSFTTPTFDSEVAPSFGTLLATVNVALNMLGEVSWPLNPSLPVGTFI